MAKKTKKSDVVAISSKDVINAYYTNGNVKITSDMFTELPDHPTPTNDGDLKDLEKTR